MNKREKGPLAGMLLACVVMNQDFSFWGNIAGLVVFLVLFWKFEKEGETK